LNRSQGKTEKSSKASQCTTIYQRRKSYLLGHHNDKENQEGTESLQRKLANYGERTNSKLHRWKQSGRGAEIIRLDNAGENKLLQQRSQSADWKLNMKFEFTACDTPQQNHLAELGFAYLAN
jgi:hypothetical protein